MKKFIIVLMLSVAMVCGAIVLAAFAPDPHEQVVAGIKAAHDACLTVGPRDEYERKVCALVAP